VAAVPGRVEWPPPDLGGIDRGGGDHDYRAIAADMRAGRCGK
jgi:hypothetical protein